MENLLSLDISHSSNTKILKIVDTSFLVGDVENMLLEILPPNKTNWLTYQVFPKFTFVANASNLKLAKANTITALPDLPDGVYEIKISHKPNFLTSLHFYHFRISSLKNKYENILKDFYCDKCNITKKEFSEKRTMLLNIFMDMMAAVAIVEKGHDKKKGIEMYSKIESDLKYFDDACKC